LQDKRFCSGRGEGYRGFCSLPYRSGHKKGTFPGQPCLRPAGFSFPKRNSIDPEEKFVGQWICKSLRILNRESRKLLKLQALGLVLHLLLNVADAIGAYRLASISANWARNPFHDSAEPMRFWRLCSGARCECLLPAFAFRTSYVE